MKKGHKAGDKTYRVHIDGYNLLPYLTGQEKKSPRKGFIYFSDDGDLVGIRFDKLEGRVHDTEPAVNQLTIQSAINLKFGVGWSLATSPVITANCNAENGQQWTVPLGLGISKVAAIGQRPSSLSVQFYSNVERPNAAPKSQLRFVVALLFPVAKRSKQRSSITSA